MDETTLVGQSYESVVEFYGIIEAAGIDTTKPLSTYESYYAYWQGQGSPTTDSDNWSTFSVAFANLNNVAATV